MTLRKHPLLNLLRLLLSYEYIHIISLWTQGCEHNSLMSCITLHDLHISEDAICLVTPNAETPPLPSSCKTHRPTLAFHFMPINWSCVKIIVPIIPPTMVEGRASAVLCTVFILRCSSNSMVHFRSLSEPRSQGAIPSSSTLFHQQGKVGSTVHWQNELRSLCMVAQAVGKG